jgi:nitrate reductase gamma subunit
MSDMDLLLWARGPGMQIALAIFVGGMLLKLFEIFSLGRKKDLSVPRPGNAAAGWKTIVSRSLPNRVLLKRTLPAYLMGYTFHIGFFVSLLFFAPHIQLFRNTFGLGWPALPSQLVDGVSLLAILALLLALVYRLYHPVKRFLSTFDDYASWALTLAPLLSGYLAFHHLLLPYTLMLAVHILSVELLLVFMPFTKLIHTMSLFISRWYNGDALGRKGARL